MKGSNCSRTHPFILKLYALLREQIDSDDEDSDDFELQSFSDIENEDMGDTETDEEATCSTGTPSTSYEEVEFD